MKKSQIFASSLIMLLILLIFISPERFILAAANGLNLWWVNVLPAILPFLLFSKILTGMGLVEKCADLFSPVTKKLFQAPGISGYPFLIGIMSGYPIGAKLCADLYSGGKVSKGEAVRMLSFSSNSGPMFILGTVGIGMLASPAAGYIILLSHALGAVLNGIAYRNLKVKDSENRVFLPPRQKPESFSDTVTSSVLAILSVGAIIMMFTVIIEGFSPFLNLLPSEISAVLTGLVEMTYGSLKISSTHSLLSSVFFCTFLISFGGFSTMIQSLALISELELPFFRFFLFKLTHGIFSVIISILLALIFL